MYKYSPYSIILNKGQYGTNQLILSDAQVPRDKRMLEKLKISSVISIGQEAGPKKKQQNINYFLIKLRDQPNEDAKKYFIQVISIIQKYRPLGNVLVNCFHGVSRSSTFSKMTYQESFNFVKQRRSCISPNQGFKKQLKQFNPQKQVIINEKN